MINSTSASQQLPSVPLTIEQQIVQKQASLPFYGRFVSKHYQGKGFLAAIAKIILRIFPSLQKTFQELSQLQNQLELATPSTHQQDVRDGVVTGGHTTASAASGASSPAEAAATPSPSTPAASATPTDMSPGAKAISIVFVVAAAAASILNSHETVV